MTDLATVDDLAALGWVWHGWWDGLRVREAAEKLRAFRTITRPTWARGQRSLCGVTP